MTPTPLEVTQGEPERVAIDDLEPLTVFQYSLGPDNGLFMVVEIREPASLPTGATARRALLLRPGRKTGGQPGFVYNDDPDGRVYPVAARLAV